ncbi:MAG: pseudouridine-5'-phosphate glycosidase [Defluviitaleaceae bacterium]|nr:pseudouridine-5'-phosphate glycosidase [Defluviitaleaceae bacterium]
MKKQLNKNAELLSISEEVLTALEEKKPVVALESTIIAHGFNYPENLECALACEKVIRETSAVPATIAILDGKIKIGLSHKEIEYLAVNSKNIIKCSVRDLAVVLSQKLDGATTVAGTMFCANAVGIPVFATGGIGGVHRNASTTFDISADLEELACTPVAVVCAGAKSILDIPLTREYLETGGVPVVGYNTYDFPNFYTRKSGTEVDYNLPTTKAIAQFIRTSQQLDLTRGMLICCPIPKEYELDFDYIDKKIRDALEEAQRQGITGKETTPFLLAKICEVTDGKSVAANKALVYNNSKVAAEIAVELAAI